MFKKFFLIVVVFSGMSVYAQEQDFRSWFSAELDGEAWNLIDFTATTELRLFDNSTRFDAVLLELDLSTPVTKFLRLGIEYRYMSETNFGRINSQVNRFGIYAELDHKINRFSLAYRALYLNEYTNINTSELGVLPEALLRQRISVKYRAKGSDFTPGLSIESFYALIPKETQGRQKIRISAGLRYRYTKKIYFKGSYKFQKELFQNNPLLSNIISLGFEYKL